MKRSTTSTRTTVLLLLLYWGRLSGLFLIAAGTGLGCAKTSPADTEKAEPGFWQKLKTALNSPSTELVDTAGSDAGVYRWIDREKLGPVKGRPLGPPSVTERYGIAYDLMHPNERQWSAKLAKSGVANPGRHQDKIKVWHNRAKDTSLSNKLAPNIKVFGWHPYWMKTAYTNYRFDLLSYLAWFSYSIDSTGQHRDTEVMKAWLNAKPLVDAAHARQCKVLLTITNHTPGGNKALLKSPELQDALIADLLPLLEKGKGDGIDVNFEFIPPKHAPFMAAFIKKLSQALKNANPAYVLTVDLPAYDRTGAYDLPELDKYVDLFILMGYDYYSTNSKSDGPMAPLDAQNGHSVRHSVERYLKADVKRTKLILGLPYYGAVWTGQSPLLGQADPSLKLRERLAYSEIKATYRTQKPTYDAERWSGYYMTFNRDSNYYEKCWFDDSLTLSRKYDWVLQQKLAGTGIWALGFDDGHPELWNLIAAKYASDTLLVYRDPLLDSRYFRLSKALLEYRSLLVVAGVFILVFLVAGLVIALFDWRVREVFFQNKTLRLLYTLSGFAIPLCIYAFYLYVSGHALPGSDKLPALAFGLFMGVCLTLYINHFFEKNRRILP